MKSNQERRMGSPLPWHFATVYYRGRKVKTIFQVDSYIMVTSKLLLRRSLPNGLCLEVYDRSRPMAGDRWQVTLELRLSIPVSRATMPADLADRAQEVMEALGPEIFFTQKEVHHFIDAREVPGLLKEIKARLLEGLEGYLGHPDFPSRYIRQKFAEHQERQRWVQE